MKLKKYSKEEILSKRYHIGIDQSLSHTGVTVYDREKDKIVLSAGIETNPKDMLLDRVLLIRDNVLDILNLYPDSHINIEGLGYSPGRTNNRDVLFGLFMTLLLTIYEHNSNTSVEVVTPKTLKKKSTGNGLASKEEMLKAAGEDAIKRLKELSEVKSKKKFEDIIDSYFLSIYFK